MPVVLLGAAALIALFYVVGRWSNAKDAARQRAIGGGAALFFAALLLLRGEVGLAIPLGGVGLALLGWVSLWPPRFPPRRGRISRVRSAFVEVEFDHDSGAMRGRILAGRYAGTSLDALEPKILVGLLGEIDGDSRQLVIAYLDRRAAGWREYAQGDAAAGRGGRTASGGKMTEEEAYQVLGLQSGASVQDVARAYRALIKKLHPDQGGTTYLAARVNEAKDVLLRRHR